MLVMERISFSLTIIVLLFVCKATLANTLEHGQPQQQQLLISANEEEQRRENEAARDLMRYLFLVFRNNYPVMSNYGRNTLGGIPFRPVRRMGSEFLGKRSENPYNELIMEDKRALGSEFLGKRRLGSEFLGKRAEGYETNKEDGQWSHDLNTDKRALGSEFLGKRKPNLLWDWSWKRGLGSEFLGKRVLGSEFLGKRSIPNDGEGTGRMQEVVGPASALENIPSETGSSRI